MINKKLGVLALAIVSMGLVACGEEDVSLEQGSSFPVDPINLQMTGSIAEARDGFQASWNPGADSTYHFEEGEENGYRVLTLKNVVLSVDDQFKFTFNDKWDKDFGYTGIAEKETGSIYANFANESGNAKVLVAGTYNFTYHPFAVVEDLSASMVVTLAA